MAHPLCVVLLVMTISDSSAQIHDYDFLTTDFINSLRTTTIAPKSCGAQKECVPFYSCKAVDSDDSLCDYPDTCCDVADKTQTRANINVEGLAHYERCGFRKVGSNTTGSAENGTDFAEFPWLATLMIAKEPSPENFFCNGVIIGPTVVLTNGNCAEVAPQEFFVRAGEWIRLDEKNTHHRARRVVKVIIHERYDLSTFSYSIALLIVESPFQWEEKVRPVCLAEPSMSFDETRCYFTNWTKDKPRKSNSQAILKRVDAPIWSREECTAKLQGYVAKSHLNRIIDVCAGGTLGKNYDVYDSGSPLVCPVPGMGDRYFLAGITTHYSQRKDASGKSYIPSGVPRVYISIRFMLQWIFDKLTENGIEIT